MCTHAHGGRDEKAKKCLLRKDIELQGSVKKRIADAPKIAKILEKYRKISDFRHN